MSHPSEFPWPWDQRPLSYWDPSDPVSALTQNVTGQWRHADIVGERPALFQRYSPGTRRDR